MVVDIQPLMRELIDLTEPSYSFEEVLVVFN
jgi:hypothetical protein